jgi:hypothetical protein
MSFKSERLTYKSYVKINEDLIVLINKIVNDNMKQMIPESNSLINEIITSYINLSKQWLINIENLSKINDITKANEYIINNHIELESCKKKLKQNKINLEKYNFKISQTKDELSELITNDKCFSDWTIYSKIIEFEINLILYNSFFKSCNLEIKIKENLYIINKIYYKLFTNINNNKITIEEIKDKINKLEEYLEEIEKSYIIFIINRGIENFKFNNMVIYQSIITEFKKFTYREHKWTKTWNKTIQKYAVITDIQSLISKLIFEIMKENIFSNISNEIETIVWNQVIDYYKKIVEHFSNIAQEKKIKAQNSFTDLITKLKEYDLEAEIQESKEIEIKKALEKKKAEDEIARVQLIIEREEKLKEIEKIKKEEENKEKERKKIEAEKKAANKAADKLLNQQKFLNKKK